MANPPVHCDHCGLFFFSKAFSVNAINALMRGNEETCPQCGELARGLDGTFDFVGNEITVRSATPRTLEILKALQAAIKAEAEGKSDDEIISHVEKASPELAAATKEAAKTGGRGLLAVILVLLAAQCSMSVNSTLDINQLIDQVHVYTTGSAPYPGSGQTQKALPSEQKAGPNRQQRRQQERQSRKTPQSSGPRAALKPKKPGDDQT